MLIQYGGSREIAFGCNAFAQQLIDMYTQTIGEWSRWLIAAVAFLCMLKFTLTVLDGYARTLFTSAGLINRRLLPSSPLCLILRGCRDGSDLIF